MSVSTNVAIIAANNIWSHSLSILLVMDETVINNQSSQTSVASADVGDAASAKADKSDRQPSDPGESPKVFTEEEVKRRLERERRAWEKQLKEAEEKARLSEAERLQREADELRQQIRLRDARDYFITHLQKLGARSPQLLFAAIERQLEFDESGKVRNTDDLIAELKHEYPEQFGAKVVPVPSVNAGAGAAESPALTLEKLQRMSPDEIKRLDWEQVKAVMSAANK